MQAQIPFLQFIGMFMSQYPAWKAERSKNPGGITFQCRKNWVAKPVVWCIETDGRTSSRAAFLVIHWTACLDVDGTDLSRNKWGNNKKLALVKRPSISGVVVLQHLTTISCLNFVLDNWITHHYRTLSDYRNAKTPAIQKHISPSIWYLVYPYQKDLTPPLSPWHQVVEFLLHCSIFFWLSDSHYVSIHCWLVVGILCWLQCAAGWHAPVISAMKYLLPCQKKPLSSRTRDGEVSST